MTGGIADAARRALAVALVRGGRSLCAVAARLERHKPNSLTKVHAWNPRQNLGLDKQSWLKNFIFGGRSEHTGSQLHLKSGVYHERLGRKHIRLLSFYQIGDNVSGTRVECRVETYPLTAIIGDTTETRYRTLSYTWGHAEEPVSENAATQQINLNGVSVFVTPNLYDAIQDICLRQEPSYWWIDALCIDQSDDTERSAQVSIMPIIYHCSEATIVWLGRDSRGDTLMVREVMRALLQKYVDYGRQIGRKYPMYFLQRSAAFSSAGLPPPQHSTWLALRRFWQRRWFDRIWVQQEVALAQTVQFWCGNIEFTYYELLYISRFLTLSGLNDTLQDANLYGVKKAIGTTFSIIDDLRDWSDGVPFDEPSDTKLMTDRLVGRPRENQHPLLRHFVQMLSQSFWVGATDARDKIFVPASFIALLAEARGTRGLAFSIDYTKPMQEVFRDATAWIISESQCLGALCWVNAQRPVPEHDSWVPDFAAETWPSKLQALMPVEHDVPQHLTPKVRGATLKVYGRHLGVVTKIGDTLGDLLERGLLGKSAQVLMEHDSPDSMISWLNLLMSQGESEPNRTDHDKMSIQDFKEILIYVVVANMKIPVSDIRNIDVWRQVIRTHLDSMPSLLLLGQHKNMAPKKEDFDEILSSIESLTEFLSKKLSIQLSIVGRRIFVTHDARRLWIGPEVAEKGDQLWELAGAPLPVLLRRRGDAFNFVGEAAPDTLRGGSVGVGLEDWQALTIR